MTLRTIRVALVVPRYSEYENRDPVFKRTALRDCSRNHELDLIVFPEHFLPPAGNEAEAVRLAYQCSRFYHAPVLTGVSIDGYQFAVYANHQAHGRETKTHVYVKHSTTQRVAFDLPDYGKRQRQFLTPIRLQGWRIGVQICHDMFYGLIGEKMRRQGANLLIDLSGGDVVQSKWLNVCRARSLDLNMPFLCTMGRKPFRSGSAISIAAVHGRLLHPVKKLTEPEGFGGFDVYSLTHTTETPNTVTIERPERCSSRRYNDITIGTARGVESDIQISLHAGRLLIHAKGPGITKKGWRIVHKGRLTIGILPLPLTHLRDGLAVFKHLLPPGSCDAHILVYWSSSDPQHLADILPLMRVRAIEHRMAVLLLAGKTIECLKTNNYKNIQHFQQLQGVFGLNLDCLGGTWSTAGKDSSLGIPLSRFSDYLALRR